MTTRRLTSLMEEWVEQALDVHALAEAKSVRWEQSFMMTEQGAQVLMAFFIPGAIVGSTAQAMAIVQNPSDASYEDIESLVKQMMEKLREIRSEQISLADMDTGDGQG